MRRPARVALCVLAAVAAGCTPRAAPSLAYDIAMCPEPWRIEDCTSSAKDGATCGFVAAEDTRPGGQPRAWAYDAEGAEVTNFALPVVPGSGTTSTRVRLTLDHAARPVRRIVVCSVDPRQAVVRDRITEVVAASLSNR